MLDNNLAGDTKGGARAGYAREENAYPARMTRVSTAINSRFVIA